MTSMIEIDGKWVPVKKLYCLFDERVHKENNRDVNTRQYFFLSMICMLCIVVSILYIMCGLYLIETAITGHKTNGHVKARVRRIHYESIYSSGLDTTFPGSEDNVSRPIGNISQRATNLSIDRNTSGHIHMDNYEPTEKVDSPFNNYRIVCYYVIPSNQTHSRQLPPSYVDPYLCTHIIVGFAAVLNGTLAPVSTNVLEVYKTIVSFKEMNPSMKVLLSVEDFSSYGQFGKMVADENLRSKFSVHIINYLESMKFDGVDLDWEFPSWPAADEEQKKNFTLLLQNIRTEITRHNNQSYILSVAVGAPEAIIDQSYIIKDIAKYADFINLMSYDYHMYTKYLPLTGPNSPLFSRATDQGYLQTMNVNWSASNWYNRGMPLKKINIGIPTYGHSFRLVNEDNNGWNAPANGFGDVGSQGFTTYPDACHFISHIDANKVFDETYLVPYAFKDRDWISYDDEISVESKANYIKENKFGGAMIYSLNSDDFYGECSTVKFPLLRRITNILSVV